MLIILTGDIRENVKELKLLIAFRAALSASSFPLILQWPGVNIKRMYLLDKCIIFVIFMTKGLIWVLYFMLDRTLFHVVFIVI